MNKQRIIGKHALIIVARGNIEIASQIFVYDKLREVRVNLEELEVKVLMTYDDSYFRVFKIEKTKDINENEAKNIILRFYNDLLNASMKLTEEEKENLKKQREEQQAKIEKNNKAKIENK